MTVIFAFLAGTLSILSPCVLPILPLVLGGAASEHRAGPAALAAGLTVSFVAVGMFIATIGFSIGLNTDVFRAFGAVIAIAIGLVLLLPGLQARLATAGGPLADWAGGRIDAVSARGLAGQFLIGALLGAMWTPCVGPTLGAASLLAAQGRDLPQVALTMLAFGIGASLPLFLLAAAGREALMRWRAKLANAGAGAKRALAVILILMGGLVITGLDRPLESALVDASPQWLTDVTTRF